MQSNLVNLEFSTHGQTNKVCQTNLKEIGSKISEPKNVLTGQKVLN